MSDTGYTDSGDEQRGGAISPPLDGHLHRPRTEAELRAALHRFCDAVWSKDKFVHIFSIPPSPDDADMILADGITELVQARIALVALQSEAPHE